MPPKGEFWKRKRAWERSEQKCPKKPYVIPGGVGCVQEVWGVRCGSGHKQSKVPAACFEVYGHFQPLSSAFVLQLEP